MLLGYQVIIGNVKNHLRPICMHKLNIRSTSHRNYSSKVEDERCGAITQWEECLSGMQGPTDPKIYTELDVMLQAVISRIEGAVRRTIN